MSRPGGDAAPPLSPLRSRFYLIRHGESVWNAERRIQGQKDPPLSDRGRAQAHSAGLRFRGRHWEAAYTSDLLRAAQTSSAIVESGIATPEVGLREIALGEWEGKTTAEIADQSPELWEQWKARPDWDLVPGGEGAEAFEQRIVSTLEMLRTRHPRGDVLLVTHGGVIQIALGRLLGRGSTGLFPFRIDNASVTIVEGHEGSVVIKSVNDTSHLEWLERGR
jgi:probable phosphoglycerate mutase